MPDRADQAKKFLAVAYLTKPLDVSSLLQMVDERLVPGRVHK